MCTQQQQTRWETKTTRAYIIHYTLTIRILCYRTVSLKRTSKLVTVYKLINILTMNVVYVSSKRSTCSDVTNVEDMYTQYPSSANMLHFKHRKLVATF